MNFLEIIWLPAKTKTIFTKMFLSEGTIGEVF